MEEKKEKKFCKIEKDGLVSPVIQMHLYDIPEESTIFDLGSNSDKRDSLWLHHIKRFEVFSGYFDGNRIKRIVTDRNFDLKKPIPFTEELIFTKGMVLEKKYGAVILLGAMDRLTKEKGFELCRIALEMLIPGGIIFVDAYTTMHPSYNLWKFIGKETGKNFFLLKRDKCYQSFYEPGELLTFLEGSHALYYENHKKTMICARKPF